MKKPELLSPAGNFESLKAAILAGCDAVYLGGKSFGARTFASNFNDEELIEAINYAHLYGVKLYVTVNTLIYDSEVEDFIKYVDFLHKNNVDALIIQDIGMMDLVRKTFPNLELHASTQMHIHNIEGVKLVEKLGLKRAVLARETCIDTIKYIKENTNIELEIFIHGALCVSYSGECLMSSLIGGRSGNRGSCAGTCRQLYSINGESKYFLSTKDLCTLEHVGELIDINVDSLKIEGRMKSPAYVYTVTKLYRKAIDSYLSTGKVFIDEELLSNLRKIFNREFTKGFIFNEKNNNFVNDYRPNHLGVAIGKVIENKNNFVTIKLTDDINVQDGIRFMDTDSGTIITLLYKDKKRINHALKNDIISIPFKDKVNIGSVVSKTTDYLLNKEINNLLMNNKKISINGSLNAKIGENIKFIITDSVNEVEAVGGIASRANNAPITKERIKEQLSKLGNTIYEFETLNIISDDNIFISIKELNDLKNEAVNLLNTKRLYKYEYKKCEYKININNYPQEKIKNIYLNDIKYYNYIKDYDFKNIYTVDKISDNRNILKLDRVMNEFPNYNEEVLVGELGSINKYKGVITDFSLNVVNSYSVALLHSLGVKRITLSHELNYEQIKELIQTYEERYNKHPNLELIIFGKEEVMVSKYTIHSNYIKDRFNNKYPIFIRNSLMYIYNYKTRNMTENYFEIGVNSIRYNIIDDNDLKLFLS